MNKTAKFLNMISEQAKNMILENIGGHYGISSEEAYEEVTDAEAENLIDYVTGSARSATSVLMQKYGFSRC